MIAFGSCQTTKRCEFDIYRLLCAQNEIIRCRATPNLFTETFGYGAGQHYWLQ